MRAKNLPEPIKTKSNRLHDTEYLLRQYRSVNYTVRLSTIDLEARSKSEYGVALSTLETNAELAGIDLSNTRIESYTRSVARSIKMMNIIDGALEAIKEDHWHGECMYYTVYFTFLSKKRYRNRDAILQKMEEQGYSMSVSTYHYYLKMGIRELDRVLWGYASAESKRILDSFVRKEE